MRILVLDQECMGLDFVLRCVAAGHEVHWYRFSPRRAIRDGEGFKGFTIVDDWRDSMEWVGQEGLVFPTGNFRFLQELDRWTELGWKVFGPSLASAELEVRRSKGLEVMQAAGIEVPPYQEFISLEAATVAARRSSAAQVFKTLGDEDDKSLTYVSDSPEDMVGWLRQKSERGLVLKGPCILQQRLDLLCELGVSGWLGPEGFLPERWQICFEHKKLCDGEIGPNTGEMGTVCQYVEEDKLAEQMLKPLEPVLRALGHRGDFAIGAGIDRTGKAWPLEFTARAGWPAFFIQLASHRGDPAKWMLDLLNGCDSLRVSTDPAIGVVMAQPLWPYNKSPPERVEGNPIRGLDEVWDDVHPVGVMKQRGGYATTGELVLVATALGKTLKQARRRAYEVVESIHFPDAIYRSDIGCKVADALPALHRHGYAKELVT